jgi:type II secretory pathway component PulL
METTMAQMYTVIGNKLIEKEKLHMEISLLQWQEWRDMRGQCLAVLAVLALAGAVAWLYTLTH